jgi:hypothetical protein
MPIPLRSHALDDPDENAASLESPPEVADKGKMRKQGSFAAYLFTVISYQVVVDLSKAIFHPFSVLVAFTG